jgi:chromosomal replication initiation ATPase DnaA
MFGRLFGGLTTDGIESIKLVAGPDHQQYLVINDSFFFAPTSNPFQQPAPNNKQVSSQPKEVSVATGSSAFFVPAENRQALTEEFKPLNEEQAAAYKRGLELIEFTGPQLAGLFFEGEAGSGKTQIATQLAVIAKKKGLRVFIVNETNLKSEMNKAMGIGGIQDYNAFIKKYDLFIIDDMNGLTNMIERDFVNDLITHAHDQGNKKIIFTSNKSFDNFISRNIDIKVVKNSGKRGVETSVHGTEQYKKLYSRLTAAIKPDSSVFHFSGKDLRAGKGF